MPTPASFCTIATKSCAYELIGLLLSLSKFHPKATVFIMCDSATQEEILAITPQPRLSIHWVIDLNTYTALDRKQMEAQGIFKEFLKSKAKIMKHALNTRKDVLFLDSDMILTAPIVDINKNRALGVSKQYLVKASLEETGYYNAGMLWTNSKDVCEDWMKFTEKSRYFEQTAIEDLVNKYSNFKFGEEYNVQCWRYYLGSDPHPFHQNFSASKEENMVYYKKKPLRCIHTHFRDKRFTSFNNLILSKLDDARLYGIMALCFRVIYGGWVIRIPQFQFQDSFRELAYLWGQKNTDVHVLKTKDHFCWLNPNILFYDRPTLEWCSGDVSQASLFLSGNGDTEEWRSSIKKTTKAIVKPWIFWPRRPTVLEHFIQTNPSRPFFQRPTECIFIGNIENKVQEKFRIPFIKEWKTVVPVFECFYGKQHRYTALQYLEKMQMSKFGLCIRGYGVKCHREIELMALGTVPIVTRGINTRSYAEPLQEGKHFFRVDSPPELKVILTSTTPEKWRQMSMACQEWYTKNVHSDHSWNTCIERILFE